MNLARRDRGHVARGLYLRVLELPLRKEATSMSRARVLVLSLGWLALTQPAGADVVVGTGTASSCTEAAFGAAVASVSAAGGTITFNCGGPATIILTSQKLFQNFGNPNLVYAID